MGKFFLAIFCITALSNPVYSWEKFRHFSYEKGGSDYNIDHSEFDSDFSGIGKLDNWELDAKIGWRTEGDFRPPVEFKLIATALQIYKSGLFNLTCLPGGGGEFTVGAGQFLNVSFGSILCSAPFTTVTVYNTNSPGENPYKANLLRHYAMLGMLIGEKKGSEYFLGYKVINDQLDLEGVDLEGPNVIRQYNLVFSYTQYFGSRPLF